jgi:hypothetical protein
MAGAHEREGGGIVDRVTARRGLPVLLGLACTLLAAVAASAPAVASSHQLPGGLRTDGSVWAIAGPDDSGRTYIGGDFDHVLTGSGSGIEVSASGAPWQPGRGPVVTGGAVLAVAPDGTGGWIVGGTFTHVNGEPRERLAWVGADNELKDWNPRVEGTVRALAYSDAQNRVFVGGEFTRVDGRSRPNLAALTLTESTDDALVEWATGGANGAVHALALSEDGDALFVGGDFQRVNHVARSRVAQLDVLDGRVDQWQSDADGPVRALAQSDDHLYLGGIFTNVDGTTSYGVVGVSLASGRATTNQFSLGGWQPGWEVNALAVHEPSAGTAYLYVGGTFAVSVAAGIAVNNLLRFDISPSQPPALDRFFRPQPNGTVRSLKLDGAMLHVGGDFHGAQSFAGADAEHVARINTTSSQHLADSDWLPQVDGPVYAIGEQNAGSADAGELFLGGAFAGAGAVKRSNLARIHADGTLDRDWNPGTNAAVHALAIRDSWLYVGGMFSRVGRLTEGEEGVERNLVARLRQDTGDVDAWWNPNIGGSVVDTLYLDATDRVFAGGVFDTVDDMSGFANLAQLTSTGAVEWFKPQFNKRVRVLAGHGDLLYAGGEFERVDNISRPRLARFDLSSGTLDRQWAPQATGTVRALALGDDGSLFVGGEFGSAFGDQNGNHKRHRLAKLDPSGAVVPEWRADGENGGVKALALYGDDLYVGGDFNRLGGAKRERIARVSASTGALHMDFTPALRSDSGFGSDPVLALHARGNRVVAGGRFTRAGVVDSPDEVPSRGLSSYAGATLEEAQLSFGPVRAHRDPVFLTITLVNTGHTELRPDRARIADGGSTEFSIVSDECAAAPLPPGRRCVVTIAYAPVDEGQDEAAVAFPYDGEHTLTAQVTGLGTNAALYLEPTMHDYGNVNVGQSSSHRFTLTNASDTALQFDEMAGIGAGPEPAGAHQFAVLDDRCRGEVLAPHASCRVEVAYRPTAAGVHTATLRLVADSGDAATATLAGRGAVPKASIAPSHTHDFGTHAIGSPGPVKKFVITSVGTGVVELTESKIIGPDVDGFDIVADKCGRRSLRPDDTCTITLRFDPRSDLRYVATLSVPANVEGGALTVGLTGTGTFPPRPIPQLSSSSVTWRRVRVGTAQAVTLSLSNAGDASLVIDRIGIQGSNAFTLLSAPVPPPEDLCHNGKVLDTGDACDITIVFTALCVPGGEHSATLAIRYGTKRLDARLRGLITGGPCPESPVGAQQPSHAPGLPVPAQTDIRQAPQGNAVPPQQTVSGTPRTNQGSSSPRPSGPERQPRDGQVMKLNGATVSLLTAGPRSAAPGTITVTRKVVRTGKLPIASVTCCTTNARSVVVTASARRGKTVIGRARTIVKRGKRARMMLTLTRRGRALVRAGKGPMTVKLAAREAGQPRRKDESVSRTVWLDADGTSIRKR